MLTFGQCMMINEDASAAHLAALACSRIGLRYLQVAGMRTHVCEPSSLRQVHAYESMAIFKTAK